jgi:hypothetical protein
VGARAPPPPPPPRRGGGGGGAGGGGGGGGGQWLSALHLISQIIKDDYRFQF